MSTLPRILIPALLGLPLFGAVVSLLAGRFAFARRAAFIGMVLAAACAAVALLSGRFDPEALAALPTYGPWTWLGVPGQRGVAFGLTFDPLALLWAAGLFGTTALLLFGTDERPDTVIPCALAATAGVCVVAAPNLVQVLVGGGIVTVAVFVMTIARDERGSLGVSARRVLLQHLLADGLLVIAIVLAGTEIGTTTFAGLGTGAETRITAYLDVDEETLPGRLGTLNLIGFALLGYVALRCFGFPFFGTAFDAGDLPRVPAGIGLAVAGPCVIVVLVRTGGIVAAASQVGAIGALVGGMTCLLAGVSTLAREERGGAIGLAAAAWLGVAVTGLASSGTMLAGLALAIAAGPAFAALLEDDRPLGTRTTGGFGSAWCGAALLAISPFGANAIVEAHLLHGGPTGVLVSGMLLVGVAGASFGVVRVLVGPDEPDDVVVTGDDSSFSLPAVLLIAGTFFGIGLAVDGWLTARIAADVGAAEARVLGLGLVTIASLVGGVGGYVLREAEIVARTGALGRLARDRFHLPAVLELAVVLPLRGIAQLGRFVDWFVIDGLVSGLPRFVLRTADASGDGLRRAAVPVAILASVLATTAIALAMTW